VGSTALACSVIRSKKRGLASSQRAPARVRLMQAVDARRAVQQTGSQWVNCAFTGCTHSNSALGARR
jgi:hypothetical protein